MTAERLVAAAVAVGLLAGMLALVRRNRRGGERVNDPLTVFLAIWGGSLFLFAMPVIDYTPTSATAWLVVYGSIASFLSGAWLASRRESGWLSAPRGSGERLSTHRINLAWVVTGALSLVGFASFVAAIDATVGWQALFQDPGSARTAQGLPQFEESYGAGKALSYLAPVSLLLWTVAFRDRQFSGVWKFASPAVILVLLPYFLIGERLSLMTAVVWIVAFHFVWRPLVHPRRVAIGAIVLMVAGLSYFYAIGNQKGSTVDGFPSVRAAVTRPFLEPVAIPYAYATANVPVFGQLMRDPLAPTTYGELTFLPASTVVHRILPVEGNPPELGGFYGIPFSSYNAATWLDPFYRDFGVLGALVMPSMFGFLITWAFFVARRRRTLISSWLAAIGMTVVVFSPLKNPAQDAITWELVALAPIVGLFVSSEARESLRLRTAGLRSQFSFSNQLIALLGASALLVISSLILLAMQRSDSGPGQSAITPNKLRNVAAVLARSYNSIPPSYDEPAVLTTAITSRLRVNDPDTSYVELKGDSVAPDEPNVVGVYADEAQVSLTIRVPNGKYGKVDVAFNESTREAEVSPYQVETPNLIANGGFEDSALQPWLTLLPRGSSVSATDAISYSGMYSLRIEVDDSGNGILSVLQSATAIPTSASGSRYTLEGWVRTRALSRRVPFALRFGYEDGSYEFSTERTSINAAASPRGDSAWSKVEVTLDARKTLSSITAFPVNALEGTTGTLWIDEIQLTEGD